MFVAFHPLMRIRKKLQVELKFTIIKTVCNLIQGQLQDTPIISSIQPGHALWIEVEEGGARVYQLVTVFAIIQRRNECSMEY